MNRHSGFFIHRGMLVIALAVLAVGIIVSIRHNHTSGEAGYEYHPGRGDTINVAIAYSPMSLYRYADTLGGFNYEMLRDMGRMYGDKLKFYPVTSVSKSLEELSDGRYDILVADIPVTATLKDRFRLSVPVYTDRMVLVSRDTTINSTLELAGRQVWVVSGAPSVERLQNLSREIGDSIHICDSHTYTAEQLVMLVAAGDIPRAVVNRAVAERLMAEYPDLRISTNISFSQFQSWIMNKKRTSLADSIDAQIERFKLTTDYKALIEKFEI